MCSVDHRLSSSSQPPFETFLRPGVTINGDFDTLEDLAGREEMRREGGGRQGGVEGWRKRGGWRAGGREGVMEGGR